MLTAEFGGNARPSRRVLFVQATEPAAYPPLIHASILMAEAGYEVTLLAAPTAGDALTLPNHPRVVRRAIPPRPSHVMGKSAYARYVAAAARLALSFQPDIVYASDPVGAGPGLLAARLARARLVYHEHDSPEPGALRAYLARARAAAAQRAELVIFPNEARAQIAKSELGFSDERLRVVWNMPRRAEVPALDDRPDIPLMLYYHGSITPERLPLSIVEAVRRSCGRARMQIAGYEAPGAVGHVRQILDLAARGNSTGLVTYAGKIPERAALIAMAARAHVGLAVVPRDRGGLNLGNMTGASNKPFDYMAAGLALLVSDRPDWCRMFAARGFARVCDPMDPGSIAAALSWFINHPAERRAMGASGRAKILAAWNYDTAFAPIICALADH